MRTHLKTLQKALLDQLGGCLAEYGFDKRKAQSYYRSFEWGKWCLHVGFVIHEADFDATADVAVRFNDLEELVRRDDPARLVFKGQTFSLGAELGNIADIGQQRWEVETDNDIATAVAGILNAFVEIGLPYLKCYSSRKAALEALSSDDATAWLHSPIHGERAKRAVALAWLAGDRPMVAELIKRKTKFLEDRNDFGLPAFRAFVASLEI